MSRVPVAAALLAWVGLTLLLADLRWFARSPLADRLKPYAVGAGARRATRLWSAASFREVIGPIARAIGARLARAFGVSEELTVRLERVHSSLDPTGFRVRQLGWAVGGFGAGALGAVMLGLPSGVDVLAAGGSALLGFLVVEQQLSSASQAWKRRLFLELPVLSEQLAILLGAGYSLGGALQRLSQRSDGAGATDLRRVALRIRQGLSEAEALREWAAIARVPSVDRLVAILALSGETSDLGRIVSDEARAMRRDVQRELLAAIERKNQQVWIPVTFATLLPGVIFLAVPFMAALRQYTE